MICSVSAGCCQFVMSSMLSFQYIGCVRHFGRHFEFVLSYVANLFCTCSSAHLFGQVNCVTVVSVVEIKKWVYCHDL